MKLLIAFWRLGYKVTLIKYAVTELHATGSAGPH